MGAGNSKQASAESQYVFAADSPVSFSSSVVDSLQSSPEVRVEALAIPFNLPPKLTLPKTDSVRSRNVELQVQARVTEELQRVRDTEAARLASYTEKLTPEDDAADSDSKPSLTEKVVDAVTPASYKQNNRSNASVSKEVAELKAKLERRKKLDGQDPAVEKAKESLVQCLRNNDRKPLDCWSEVEAFKLQVAKLEQKFVDRALR